MPCTRGSRAGGDFARRGFELPFEGLSRGKIVREVEEPLVLPIADVLRTGRALEGERSERERSERPVERWEDAELVAVVWSAGGGNAEEAEVPFEDSVAALGDERGLL